MKLGLKLWMAIHTGLYRLSRGKWMGSMSGSPVLLLTTTGRKSGKPHTVPLGCFDHKDGYVVVASNSGQPANPAWYHNLRRNPKAAVQLFDKVIAVTAVVLAGEARAKAWRQVIAASPSYAAYEKRTTREIPLFLLRSSK
jgi:deazaflavin-dependent oxidoreductase (nitroreductase family)